MSNVAIETHGLAKSFGKVTAVAGVDLTIDEGSVYGVLGPNGAGKTTIIRMLATLLRPDSGTATVLGHDIATDGDAVRGLVSLTGQFATIDQDLTAHENLTLLGLLAGLSRRQAQTRATELLDVFGLEDASNRLVKACSGGMQRRIDIAAGLVAVPPVLFLDEPTTGLDPRARNHVWEIVQGLASAGTTVLLTTQYLDEADQLAHRIAIIDQGSVIAEGTSDKLKASVGHGALQLRLVDPAQRDDAAQLLARVFDTEARREADPAALSVQVPGEETDSRIGRALTELADSGIALSEFALARPSLDDAFLALTGKPTSDAAPHEAALSKESS